MSDLNQIFDRLGAVEANQKGTQKAVEATQEVVQRIEAQLVGTANVPGLCTRVVLIEGWKGHITRSIRRFRVGVIAVFTGLGVRWLWSYFNGN